MKGQIQESVCMTANSRARKTLLSTQSKFYYNWMLPPKHEFIISVIEGESFGLGGGPLPVDPQLSTTLFGR